MKKTLFAALVLLSLLAIALRFGTVLVYSALGYQDRAGLKVTTTPSSRVILNGNQVGKTPYEDDSLLSGNYDLKLETQNGIWEGNVQLVRGTVTVVNRIINNSPLISSGEILTLTPGQGVLITSYPDNAQIFIDGKTVGKTPLSISDISPGAHQFSLSLDHYDTKRIEASVSADMKLVLDMDLSLTNSAPTTPITTPSAVSAVVRGTPNGFLRVRDQPSLDGNEIGKVNEGDVLTVTDQLSGWVKIQLVDGSFGYVASAYIQKQ